MAHRQGTGDTIARRGRNIYESWRKNRKRLPRLRREKTRNHHRMIHPRFPRMGRFLAADYIFCAGGNTFRLTFPFAVSGKSSRNTNADGIMCSGNLARRNSRKAAS